MIRQRKYLGRVIKDGFNYLIGEILFNIHMSRRVYQGLLPIKLSSRDEVMIVIADWAGYPLLRDKTIGHQEIQCGIGRLLPNMLRHHAGMKHKVMVVVNETTKDQKNKYQHLTDQYPFVKEVILRGSNDGRDFGAYNMGYQLLKNNNYNGYVLFMNSTVRGPFFSNWIIPYYKLFNLKKEIGVCGIFTNSQGYDFNIFQPHVQSYFLFTHMATLKKAFPDNIPGANENPLNRDRIIEKGEIQFSQIMLSMGYGICSKLFSDYVYYSGNIWRLPKGELRFHPHYYRLSNII